MQNEDTKSHINRRTVLLAVAGAAPLVMLASSAQAKMAQTAVAYQADPKDGKQCDQCSFFIAPNGCKMVDGDISPTGYCKLWNKKAS